MFNRWLWLQMLILCGWLSTANATERLRLATEGAYPPFSFINSQGQLAGFDVDIAHALCRVLEIECEIIVVPWKKLLPGLVAGRYEVIVAGMAKTPERERQAEFTNSYYRSRHVFIGHRNKQHMIKVVPETARDKVLATQDGTTYANYLRTHFQATATLKFTATLTEAFTLLAHGEVDLVMTNNLSAFDFLRSSAGQELDIIGPPLPANEISESAYLQVRKGNTQLRDKLNAALHTLWLDGTYQRVNARYFPFSIY